MSVKLINSNILFDRVKLYFFSLDSNRVMVLEVLKWENDIEINVEENEVPDKRNFLKIRNLYRDSNWK